MSRDTERALEQLDTITLMEARCFLSYAESARRVQGPDSQDYLDYCRARVARLILINGETK